ncbi:hypothetical protein B484DRAFT_402248 [Ochromonadaceae sp. CCMP2298]|nr:hypothetical protein B484DRAFT_402248 [Ochromonadaceae sp. CCMP2298]
MGGQYPFSPFYVFCVLIVYQLLPLLSYDPDCICTGQSQCDALDVSMLVFLPHEDSTYSTYSPHGISSLLHRLPCVLGASWVPSAISVAFGNSTSFAPVLLLLLCVIAWCNIDVVDNKREAQAQAEARGRLAEELRVGQYREYRERESEGAVLKVDMGQRQGQVQEQVQGQGQGLWGRDRCRCGR